MNPIVSLTASALATAPKDARAAAVIKSIATGQWKHQVNHIREEYGRSGKEGVSELKKQLPGVLTSGKFEHRSVSGLVAHSGLICADLDDLGARAHDLRRQFADDKSVYAVFLSPTGTGLKVWFRVPADVNQHAANFAAIQRRCLELYNVEIDASGKDVSRLCFVSYDPDAYLNQDAVELPSLAKSSNPPKPKHSEVAPNGSLPPSVELLLKNGVEEGRRNDQAFKLCCQLRDAGRAEPEAEKLIIEFAGRCSPPLDASEAVAALHSAYRKPPRDPARSTEPTRLKIGVATAGTTNPDQENFIRLAALSPAEYDRQRQAEADKLGIRCSTLDGEVSKWRPENENLAQGGTVDFQPVEPWPQPVDGTDLLNQVVAVIRRYIALPPHATEVLALWIAHVHVFDAFIHTPRLNLYSPEKGCGKTTVLDLLAALIPRPLRTESITPAVLFRLVDQFNPALLLDEVDTYLPDSDELRALLNAGHKRGAKAYRCEGDRHEVRGFNAFAPAVLAGIGTLPGTLHDRSIIIRLIRAKPGEVVARFDSRRTLAETELCRKLARWTSDHRSQLESIDPTMPEGAFNRHADNWRPLFAIAQTAGGDWPTRASAAFNEMTAADSMDDHGVGAAILADIRTIFENTGTDRLASAHIADVLAAMDGKPWPEFKQGKPITTNQIARLLRRFKIHSRTIRLDDAVTAKGYYLVDFDDAFSRFLPASPVSKRNMVTTIDNDSDSSILKTSQTAVLLPFNNPAPTNVCASGDGVTVPNSETEVLI